MPYDRDDEVIHARIHEPRSLHLLRCSVFCAKRKKRSTSLPKGTNADSADPVNQAISLRTALPGVGLGCLAAGAGPDLVELRQRGIRQLDLERPQAAGQLLDRARPDDRRGDDRVVQQPGQRDIGGLLAQARGRSLRRLPAWRGASRSSAACARSARRPALAFWSAPPSSPPPSGLQGISPSPIVRGRPG